MKEIGFIGAYDKIDLVIYIAKILTTLGKKILIVDSTRLQKARYVVPVIKPTVKYITEFEEMDIAVGFTDIEDIKRYLGLSDEQQFEYDYIFVDTDNSEGVENFNLEQARQKLLCNFC